MKKELLCIPVIFGLLLSSCATESPCVRDNQEYFTQMEDLVARWDTNNEKLHEMYEDKGFLYIGVPLHEQNDLYQEYQTISPPECVRTTHGIFQVYVLLEFSRWLQVIQDEQKGNEAFAMAREMHASFDEKWAQLKKP